MGRRLALKGFACGFVARKPSKVSFLKVVRESNRFLPIGTLTAAWFLLHFFFCLCDKLFAVFFVFFTHGHSFNDWMLSHKFSSVAPKPSLLRGFSFTFRILGAFGCCVKTNPSLHTWTRIIGLMLKMYFWMLYIISFCTRLLFCNCC